MQKKIIFLFIVALSLFMSGCGEDEGSGTSGTTVVAQGWHFQGRDCLACHNVDLGATKHLLIGGTLYKSKTVSNQDDLNSVCGGDFVINFLDANLSKIYTSKNYEDLNSKGYKAKGNLFILSRKLSQLTAQTFSMQITDKNGTVFAVSNFTHKFTTAAYDINTPVNLAMPNRISCNSCHIKGGVTSPLFVQANVIQCK